MTTSRPTPARAIDDRATAATGLRVAARILKKWGAELSSGGDVLGVSRSTFHKALNDSFTEIKLTRDQATRIGLIMQIHQALRTQFSNRENVEGFMSMMNNNPFFNGRRPLDVITSGDFIDLYETARRIDALRGARW